MLHVSLLNGLVTFIMPIQSYCVFYRINVLLKKTYSQGLLLRKIPAVGFSCSAVYRTRPKQFTKTLEESSAKEFSPKTMGLDHMRISEDRKLEEEGIHRNMKETLGKKVKLYDAVDPRELDWREVGGAKLHELPSHYLMLAKFRLTSLVVITSVGGYIMAPFPLELGTLIALALGTGLVSSSANAINQFLEAPFDAQMPRTRNRALVRGILTPAHAIGFAALSAVSGTCVLWTFTNASTMAFGLLNLFLYTSVYTPLKRVTIANTWVGSIVGAIPPLMGWSACSGGSLEAGAWLMAALLYAWQFPHFNALSWNLRQEYSRAGYRMMAVTDPGLCRRTALRYSVTMLALCLSAPLLDVTTWTFAFDSLPVNAYLTYLAWRFYKDSDSRSSRKLFRFTLIHLPLLMLLMLISKKHHSLNDLDSPNKLMSVEDIPAVVSVVPDVKEVM